MRLVFLKGTSGQPKTVARVSSYDTEGPCQVWRKTDSWFPIQPRKKTASFVPANQKVEISNLMGVVFLKDTLVHPKTVAGVSSYDTEGPCQVWRKTDSWFPIQPRKKSANFVPASCRVKISNLMGWFFLKGTLVEPKTVTRVLCYDTEKPWKVWGESDCRFSIKPRKKPVNFLPASQRVEISNFMVWFFVKGTLLEPKTLAGVSSYDTEGSWQVWERTDSWFPIQPRKKSSNFFPASHRVQISNLMGWFFLKGTLV